MSEAKDPRLLSDNQIKSVLKRHSACSLAICEIGVCDTTILLRHIAALNEKHQRALQSAGNLLAVMHGDGGHYISDHGWDKACRDAEAKYIRKLGEIDDLRTKAEKLPHEPGCRTLRRPYSPHSGDCTCVHAEIQKGTK